VDASHLYRQRPRVDRWDVVQQSLNSFVLSLLSLSCVCSLLCVCCVRVCVVCFCFLSCLSFAPPTTCVCTPCRRRRSAILLPSIWFGVGSWHRAGPRGAAFCVDSQQFAHSFVNSQHFARFAFCRIRSEILALCLFSHFAEFVCEFPALCSCVFSRASSSLHARL